MGAATACTKQGQELFAPPSVKGWDGGSSWINSSTLLERLNWAADVDWGNPDRGVRPYDPCGWCDGHQVKPQACAEALVNLLLQDDLAADSRDLILAAGRDGGVSSLRKALQLVLNCPEFQLA